MGFGFRVGSGVRVYPGGRGLGVSVGSGPVRYYTRVGAGRRSGSGRTSVTAHERQVRQAQRFEEVQAAVGLDEQLASMCRAHMEDFEPTCRPTQVEPARIDPKVIEAQLVKQAVSGISPFKLGQRREAKRAALAGLEGAIQAERHEKAEEAAREQEEADRFWAALEANDPSVVLSVLEEAFGDNEAPAAAVSCEGSRVDIVMRWPVLEDVVPEKKAAVTPTGKPTIKKRPKGERSELYLEALSSHALATAREAFAVCPSLDRIGLAVVRPSVDPARGDQILESVALGILSREQLSQVHWKEINATAAFLGNAEGRIGMRGKGSNKALFGLDLGDDAETTSFIAQIAAGLEARVPEGGIPGLPLPVKVVVE